MGGADPPVAIITNFTPVPRTGYAVRLPRDGTWRERINRYSRDYGGSGMGNFGTVTAEHGSARVTLPPLATLILSHGG